MPHVGFLGTCPRSHTNDGTARPGPVFIKLADTVQSSSYPPLRAQSSLRESLVRETCHTQLCPSLRRTIIGRRGASRPHHTTLHHHRRCQETASATPRPTWAGTAPMASTNTRRGTAAATETHWRSRHKGGTMTRRAPAILRATTRMAGTTKWGIAGTRTSQVPLKTVGRMHGLAALTIAQTAQRIVILEDAAS